MEHVSKQEGTVKEGYLTELSAREAALTMQYKYKEPFNVYICSVCGKYHIGRGEMMENQEKLFGDEPKEGRPHYRHICSNTPEGFLNLLNENYEEGYKVDRDTFLFREMTDHKTKEHFIKREAYLYDSEAMAVETDPIEIEIIGALDKAEGYVIETSTSLTDEKNRLLIDTDYDLVNAKRLKDELPPVKTAPEKKAWVETMVAEREQDLAEAKRWKKYVEAMTRKGELPNRESPWEEKARLKDEELKLKDEMDSQVNAEKVQDTAKEEG